MTDSNKKSPRSFQCRESLWQKFEQMATELECSVDYLINDAMKQYARQRGYGTTTSGASSMMPSAAASSPMAGAAPPPPPPPQAPVNSAPAPSPQFPAVTTDSSSGPHPAGLPPPPGPPPPGPPAARAVPPHAAVTAPPPPLPRRAPGPPGPPGGVPIHAAPPGPPGLRRPPPPVGRSVPAPPPLGRPPPVPGPPSRAPATPATGLAIVYQGEVFPINKDRFIIGRGKQSSDLTIKDPNVSRQHAMIEFLSGQYYIVDMGSTNGVEYNGQRVQRKAINEGDVFRVCDHELRFSFQH